MLYGSEGKGKYKFTEEINSENLNKFVNSYLGGTLERFLKSEEVPESNDEPVKVIVGK